ncbi:hypothetical protein Droror1_Dr00025078, partial [Drosera rotundifolia]
VDKKVETRGNYIRVRIEIDITKALARGSKVKLKEGSTIWVSFRYERVPHFCLRCEIIGHHIQECPAKPEWQVDQEKGVVELFQYRPWLRPPGIHA